VAVLPIYRPRSVVITDAFFTELSACLEVFVLYKCHILVAGDSSVHLERPGDVDTARLHDILLSFDCVQHVPLTPTHQSGGTLDLIVTISEQVLADMTVDASDIISDHSVVSWCFPLSIEPSTVIKREMRSWSKVNEDSFHAALLESELRSAEQNASITSSSTPLSMFRLDITGSLSKSCSLDPLPTDMLKKCLPELHPRALILLKTWRYISHLLTYLLTYLTERAVLKVIIDVLRAADQQKVSLLCMLDLSAAFDTVDHDMLTGRLRQLFGVKGLALSWI